MNNVKELDVLKVKALAIPIKEGLNPIIGIIYGKRNLCFKNSPASIGLPIGNWQILGRANKLYITKNSNYGILDFLCEHGWRDYEEKTPDRYGLKSQKECWQSYFSANNLTNELILIEI